MITENQPRPGSDSVVDLSDSSLYSNRELSWLAFNQRVLDQALDGYHPLLERVKFLAIVGSNLDEFFMVRVATLLKKRRAGLETMSVDGLTVSQQLAAVRERAARMLRDQAACWNDRLRPALAEHGIKFLEPDDYSEKTRRYLNAYFRSKIYPLLTPLAFDPGHPFPVISNRSKNFAVVVRQQRKTKFARVKIPPALPRFVEVPRPSVPGTSGHSFAFLEDVIRMNLGDLFSGLDVVGGAPVPGDPRHRPGGPRGRGRRPAGVGRSHAQAAAARRAVAPARRGVDAEARPEHPRGELRDRGRGRDAGPRDRLDFSDWMSLHRLPLPHLKDATFTPRTLWASAHPDTCVFDEIRDEDFLVHHPFDSFSAVEAFVQQSATDSLVAAIKMTLYRVGPNSPLVDMLIEAADAGKQVTVLVELKARFDERNNIRWAERLEEAGVHVVYGVENLKTHCKLCLVVRNEADGVRRYVHIGTGNYSRATSQIYTDFGLFTANPRVVDDVSEVFNALTGYSRRQEYNELIVAPMGLRARLIALLEREMAHAAAGRPAHVIFKCNAVTDPAIVRALYRASQAGVRIDMIVRGVCVLKPGIKGVSETIHVRSVVGRFLEHSRVYWFENGGSAEMYIGSADLMERNLDRRVETLCRIADADIADHIRTVVLDAYLRDTDRAYVLAGDRYEPADTAGGEAFSAQQFLLDFYRSDLSAPDES